MPNKFTVKKMHWSSDRTLTKVSAIALLLLGLSACGNKGELYLPVEDKVEKIGAEAADESSENKQVEL